MNNIVIMTDTNSGITPDIAKLHGIHLLKMPYYMDGKEYIEYGEMTYSEFFEKMEAGAEVSTSQPSPGSLTESWDELLKRYDSVIYMPMTSGLSGTCQTAKMLSLEYKGKVFVVDNKRISVSLSSSVFDALKLVKSGLSASQIAETLENEASNQSVYVSVNTLEYLKKSGRVTPAGAALGSILGVKPVLTIQGGKLDAFKKVRGMKAAMDTMITAIEDDYKNRFAGENVVISVAYSGDEEQGKIWQSAVQSHFPDHEINMDALPLSISCHTGPGALGIGIMKSL